MSRPGAAPALVVAELGPHHLRVAVDDLKERVVFRARVATKIGPSALRAAPARLTAHLPPVLRFDPAGRPDALPELIDQPGVVRGVSRGGPDPRVGQVTGYASRHSAAPLPTAPIGISAFRYEGSTETHAAVVDSTGRQPIFQGIP